MATNDTSGIHQTGLKTKTTIATGTDKPNAVKADNCCGERFFCEGIPLSPKGKIYFSEDIKITSITPL